MPPVELRDGIATVVRREPDRFRLTVLDDAYEKEVVAESESFEALIDLRSQLLALGYRFHGLDSIGPINTRE